MNAREIMLKEEKERRKAENLKKYFINKIAIYNGATVATSQNWDYKLHIYSDNSAALLYIAKPGSTCSSGHYCGIDRLRAHVHDLKNRFNYRTVFDLVLIPEFFQALNIEL